MIRLASLVAAIAVEALLLACSVLPSTSNAHDEILRIDAEWSRVASEGKDVDRIVSYWADDARVLPPGKPPIVGKSAIRQFVVDSLKTPGFGISWQTTDVVVSGDSRLAYAVGTSRTTVAGPDGKRVVVEGKTVTVWERDAKSLWRCVVDIWNDAPPPENLRSQLRAGETDLIDEGFVRRGEP